MNRQDQNQKNQREMVYDSMQPSGPQTAPTEKKELKVYQFNLQYVDQFANQIFMQADSDLSGYLDVSEFPKMMAGFFVRLNIDPPNYEDCLEVMRIFDVNQDGKIGFKEYRAMLYYLGGVGR